MMSSPAKAGDPVLTEIQFGHRVCHLDSVVTGCPAFAGHDTAKVLTGTKKFRMPRHSDDKRRKPMRSHHPHSLRSVLLASAALFAVAPAIAADVTPDRLVNADREPQNWLMNHRTYDAQRYSPLDKINKANIKDLKLAYAVAIGGTSPNENLESTPLAEDGFLYLV